MVNKILQAKVKELRAELKTLEEQRADKFTKLSDLSAKAKAEVRAFTDEETAEFDKLEKEIKSLDLTISAEKRATELEVTTPEVRAGATGATSVKEEAEIRAFNNYIRGVVETRSDVNMTVGSNGAVIPSSIVNKIISKVVEISPLYEKSTKYNIGGTLNIPYYDESTNSITVAYATEFTELESTSGVFSSIQLTGYLAGCLTKVSLSLINNSQFDLVSYVVNKMAEAFAKWIECELLKGTTSKITGLSGIASGMTVTTASATALTADEQMDTQDKVIDAFQGEAIWIMNRATRTAIRKLKDSDGNYLLNRDINAKWGYTLLGKDVYTSDNVDTIAATKDVIFYGDFSGLAVKLSENVDIQVVREKYLTQHCLGVVGWIEMDAKIENSQKISKLTMKASS